LVTGSVGEEIIVDVMREGAADYLLKDRLGRLGQAVSRALQEKRLRDEKRQAQSAMRESEARFRALFENSPIGITISRDSIRLYANRAYVEMLGFQDTVTLVDVSLLDRVAPEYRDLVQKKLEKVKTNARSQELEIYLIRNDGYTVPVHVN